RSTHPNRNNEGIKNRFNLYEYNGRGKQFFPVPSSDLRRWRLVIVSLYSALKSILPFPDLFQNFLGGGLNCRNRYRIAELPVGGGIGDANYEFIRKSSQSRPFP